MRNPKKLFAGTAAYLALVATLTLTTPSTGHAQSARQTGPDVRVVNTPDQPIPVVLPNVTKELVQEEISSSRGYTVPAGKWLVIEHVSGDGFTKGDGFFAQLGIRTALEGVSHINHLWPITVTYDINGDKGYAFAGPARLYAGPGTTVEPTYGVVGHPSSSGAFATFSGYLTDTP